MCLIFSLMAILTLSFLSAVSDNKKMFPPLYHGLCLSLTFHPLFYEAMGNYMGQEIVPVQRASRVTQRKLERRCKHSALSSIEVWNICYRKPFWEVSAERGGMVDNPFTCTHIIQWILLTQNSPYKLCRWVRIFCPSYTNKKCAKQRIFSSVFML